MACTTSPRWRITRSGDRWRVRRFERGSYISWFMSSGFSTEVVREGDAIVIHVTGDVDIAAVERLRDVLEPNMGPEQTILLDLSGVEFMDSSSLRYLVQAHGDLTADGGSLNLRNPSTAARRLLTLVKAESLLVDDADQNLTN